MIFRALILGPLCLWAVANWWQAARDVSHFYIDFPVWDYLSLIDHYVRYKAADLTVFWEQHNEHRIVFPELIAAVDFVWFHGQIILPLVTSFCLYFGVWIVIYYALAKDENMPSIPRYSAAFLAAILLAWTGCAYPLASPILLQWTMSQFAAILALAFLSRHRLSPLITCAVICTYSSANGLLLWPLLICLALLIRLGGRRISIIAIAGALSSGLYFVGYKQLEPIQWRVVFTHPLYIAKFMATYVSMPFAFLRAEPDFAVSVGAVSLLALFGLLLRAWRTGRVTSPTGVILFGYAAFLLCSGLLIACGRMKVDDPTFQDAKALRFLTMPLSYWSVLAAIAIWILSRMRILSTVLVVAMSLLLLRMSHKPAFAAFSHSLAESYANQQWAALAVENGILDPEPDLLLHPDVTFVPRVVPLMRAEKLSLFAKPEAFWVGQNAHRLFTFPGPEQAEGGIFSSRKLATAVALTGWADASSPHLKVVMVDENQRIVGLGERLPLHQQWTAFVNLSYGSHTVKPYIVMEDGKTLIPLAAELKI